MKTTDDIDRKAEQLLAEDERTQRRLAPYSLRRATRDFWLHPSPWLITATLAGAWYFRVREGNWGLGDAIVPLLLVAGFPVLEWLIHVFILHAKPAHVGPVTLDSLLARKHREHHANPRDLPLVFIPWPVFLWLIPALVAISVWAIPATGLSLGTGLTYLAAWTTLGIIYEWTHFLIHSDYKPRTSAYKAIWRNHRLHHYKNEHYWFSVTTSGTSDRLFGTYPDPATVKSSPTAKNLHGTA
jgi:Fatty acid hydroxylase